MVNKPTYEQLEQRIRELEKEAVGRKRAEEALRGSEEHYRTAIEHSNDGIAIVKGDNHLYVNKKFVEIFGYDRPEEIVGKQISMVIHPRDKERVTEFNRLRQQGNPAPSKYECEGLRKNGVAIYLEVSATKSIYRGEPVSLVFLRDVTQRRQAEDLLRKQALELRERVKKINCLYGISSLVERPGASLEEIVRETVDLIPPAYQYPEITCARMVLNGQVYSTKNFKKTIWKQSIDIIVYGNRIGSLEVCYLDERPEIDEGPFTNEERDLLNAIARRLGRIVERMRAEKALRESEAQKSAILDASIDRIRYVDKDMRIIWGNKATALVHGLSPEDLVGKTCYEAFVGRNTPCEGCATVKARETGRIERAEIYQPKVKGIKGGTYWGSYCVPLWNEEGDTEGFIQIGRDITVRKLAEERIHTLSQELLKVQENERQRISRYLHDHVAQDLSTLKIGCETLFDDYPDASTEIIHKVREFSEILQGTITAVRGLAYDLRPPGLDQLGLIQSVFQYCEDFSEDTGLSVDFKAAGMDDLIVDPDIEINLYRLVQEGLNNIKKHADANNVIVRLVASFPNIIFRIEDDGKGFDVEGRLLKASKEKRMGLGSMEERVSLLNGNLRIQSRLKEGTKIFIEIPFKEKKSG